MEAKIKKSNVQEIFEMSQAQKGMLFHYLSDTSQRLYNIQLAFDVRGGFDVEVLRRAFKIVQANNEVLRSVFEWEKASKPLQIILKESDLDVTCHDLSGLEDEAARRFVEGHLGSDRDRPFDLKQLPLRVTVLKTARESFVLTITHHHILYDGWSTAILLKELFSAYQQLQNGSLRGAAPKTPYKTAFLGIAKSYDRESSAAYWKNYLAAYEIQPVFDVRGAHAEAGDKNRVIRSRTPIERLKQFASARKVTTAAVVYTAYGILLQKYRNSDDIVFGTPVSSREASVKGIDHVMGNFINTIPLRVSQVAGTTLGDLTQRINDELMVRDQFKSTSYHEIKSLLNLRPMDDLFDSILVIENYPLDLDAINGNEAFTIDLKSTYGDTGIPVVIHVFFKEELEIEIIYQAGLIDDAYIRAFSDHFTAVLNALVDAPEQPVEAVRYLSPAEKQALLFGHNDTAVAAGAERTVLDLFRQQVALHPQAAAVVFEGRTISYREADDLSNQLAHGLAAEHGIGAGDLVGVMLNRSDWMILSILGILKAGGAYVPVDPDYPAARKKSILADAAVKLLVSEMYYVFDMAYYQGPVFSVDVEFERGKYPSTPVATAVAPDQLAYVIYTSGSTGTPKGVMIEHQSLRNYIVWARDHYVRGERGNFPLFTSISFDLTVTCIFTPLVSGHAIIIHKEDEKGSLLEKVFADEACDILKLTPSHLKLIGERGLVPARSGRTKLIVGGEKLETPLARKIYDQYRGEVEIYNEYGPTEATVGCMIYAYTPAVAAPSVPIGVPIANTRIYLLDRFLEPVPAGVTGELYIAGAGLARGYLNQEALTAQKFLADPFVGGERMYKTGDLAVRLPDGNLDFIGRADNQVKIRGFRIELGDIESQLAGHPRIRQAVVTVEAREGEGRLVGYYVADDKIPAEALQQFLSGALPHYMVPAAYVRIEKVPLTINGKIDYKQLPAADAQERSSAQYLAPATPTEEALVRMWQEILGVEKVGVLDDFFVLGGHSLSATRLVSRIKDKLTVTLSLSAVFEHTTLQRLARLIDAQEKAAPSRIERVSHTGRIPLSFAQERLWFIDQMSGSLHYHLPLVWQVEGSIDFAILTRSIKALVNRQQSLRTVFRSHEGKPYQFILPDGQWEPEGTEDVSVLPEEAVEERVQATVRKPFDLANDHLLRVKWLTARGSAGRLVVVVHHIAFDGWSAPVFVRELSALYQSLQAGAPAWLGELPVQYADYARWQNEQLTDAQLAPGLQYWAQRLTGVEPLNLPTDFPRPKTLSNKGADHRFVLDARTSQALLDVAGREGATLFITLLTVIKAFMARVSGQTDLCVGTPIANREQPEVEGLVGFFTNTLAIRSEVSPEETFATLLQKVKKTTVAAFGHQQVPLEKVIERVVTRRDFSRTPLFQVMFILQAEEDLPAIRLGDARALPVRVEHGVAKFELTFEATRTRDGIAMTINYGTDLFAAATIRRLGACLEKLLASIVADPHQPLGTLDLVPEAQKQRLADFNRTQVPYPAGKTMLDLFGEQVRLRPDAVAVVFEGRELSFGELDRKSNQLAQWLIARGVSYETLVPLCLDRSPEMVIGITGILKAGAAYVPIDPEYPQERIDFMLEDTGASLVLTQLKYAGRLTGTPHRACLALDAEAAYDHMTSAPPEVSVTGSHLAYVIYTSGTTGRPKGVMNQHDGLYNRLVWMQAYLGTGAGDVILQKTTFCFDVSVWELLLPLVSGARMVLARPGGHKDTAYLQTLIAQQGVTVMHFVPSMLAVFLPDVAPHQTGTLAHVVCSGEELKSVTVADFKAALGGVALHNLYGPTEAAIDVTAIRLDPAAGPMVSIGKPIANTCIYIVDRYNNPQPVGLAGELLIGGVQVARGYLNRPELTAQKFVADPLDHDSPYRVYRTGDLARWLPDGTIEYLGRIDHQVKIRGYRIEPGEIEAALEQCDPVTQAVVLTREDAKGNKKLCAYVTCRGAFDKQALRDQLKNKLPEYMLPGAIVALEAFPLTPNGKADRRQLPEPDAAQLTGTAYTAPRSDNEKRLATIWQEVLGVERVGMHDNFFDLGGHSLLATRVLSAVQREFAVSISIHMFFNLPTIHELNQYCQVLQSVQPRHSGVSVSTIEL